MNEIVFCGLSEDQGNYCRKVEETTTTTKTGLQHILKLKKRKQKENFEKIDSNEVIRT